METIHLEIMSRELCHELFKNFENDEAIYEDMSEFKTYTYNYDNVDAYFDSKQTKDRVVLAIMLDDRAIGEIQLKKIDYDKGTCTLSIHMQSDTYKNKGYGTLAEKEAIRYAFEVLHLSTIYADTLLKNVRSQKVLEKVGFKYLKEDEHFKYYELKKC